MYERNELVARLREGTFGTDITKTDAFLNAITAKAAAQIERDGREIERLTAENQRLREVLEKIASTGRCVFSEVRAVLRNTEGSHE